MKLEDQVISLELAKRLKELGVKQNSTVLWVKDKPTKTYHLWYADVYAMGGAFPTKEWAGADVISAFTVAELGEMLPQKIKGPGPALDTGWIETFKVGRRYACKCMDVHIAWAETEADARAEMLIYLLENKLITL